MSTRPELWQDREIKFDVDKYQIKERPGEKLLAYFDPVEDTKGSVGHCFRPIHSLGFYE